MATTVAYPLNPAFCGSSPETSSLDDGLSVFIGVRSRLFAIAYRMLGCPGEAEDIVQEVWLRWQSTDRSVVENPSAFLAKTTTRLCINFAQSARSRRETCVGSEFPEPVDVNADPGSGAELGEALNHAVLMLLEKLSPRERAAYVLREAFDYPYRQIADILQIQEANVRQLVTRARKHIANGPAAAVSSSARKCFLGAFIDAAQEGDFAPLKSLLLQGQFDIRRPAAHEMFFEAASHGSFDETMSRRHQ